MVYTIFPFYLYTVGHLEIFGFLHETVICKLFLKGRFVYLTYHMQHKRTSQFVFDFYLGIWQADGFSVYLNRLISGLDKR